MKDSFASLNHAYPHSTPRFGDCDERRVRCLLARNVVLRPCCALCPAANAVCCRGGAAQEEDITADAADTASSSRHDSLMPDCKLTFLSSIRRRLSSFRSFVSSTEPSAKHLIFQQQHPQVNTRRPSRLRAPRHFPLAVRTRHTNNPSRPRRTGIE